MEFNPQILAAIAKHIAPQNDTRFYMNGVLVEVSTDGVRYVATNGHILLVAYEPSSPSALDHCSVIVPRDVCLKVKPKGKNPWPTADLQIDEKESALVYQGDRFAFNPVDATFPDYRKILPSSIEAAGKNAQFNPEYLMAFQRFSRDMGSECIPSIWGNGTSPACVTFPDTRFFGVIMPLRQDAPHYPDWLRSTLAKAA